MYHYKFELVLYQSYDSHFLPISASATQLLFGEVKINVNLANANANAFASIPIFLYYSHYFAPAILKLLGQTSH